jgi:hypothetical protein
MISVVVTTLILPSQQERAAHTTKKNVFGVSLKHFFGRVTARSPFSIKEQKVGGKKIMTKNDEGKNMTTGIVPNVTCKHCGHAWLTKSAHKKIICTSCYRRLDNPRYVKMNA